MATMTGILVNALNDSVVRRTSVVITNMDFTLTVTTDDNGLFSAAVPTGNVMVVVKAAGFYPLSTRINITVDTKLSLALSPTLDAGVWRAVLTWGKAPADLDSHLAWGTCDVSFSKKTCADQGVSAKLDVDATKGYGPETVDVTTKSGVALKYYVRMYTAMPHGFQISNAVVNVYNQTGLVQIIPVPTAEPLGPNCKVWNPFTLTGNVIAIVNTFAEC